jgi:hypothetical protein
MSIAHRLKYKTLETEDPAMRFPPVWFAVRWLTLVWSSEPVARHSPCETKTPGGRAECRVRSSDAKRILVMD